MRISGSIYMNISTADLVNRAIRKLNWMCDKDYCTEHTYVQSWGNYELKSLNELDMRGHLDHNTGKEKMCTQKQNNQILRRLGLGKYRKGGEL